MCYEFTWLLFPFISLEKLLPFLHLLQQQIQKLYKPTDSGTAFWHEIIKGFNSVLQKEKKFSLHIWGMVVAWVVFILEFLLWNQSNFLF